MNKTWLIIIAVVAVLTAMGVAQFSSPRTVVSPAPTVSQFPPTENNVATSSKTKVITVSVPARAVPALPSIAKGDTIASWTFNGAYADNPDLIAKANAEITHLLGLIGEGSYPDVSLYVAIANQYELLGNGGQEYNYLSQAIRADVNVTSGLPWHNLGVLMERLGALQTARAAYDKAALIQPQMKFYHYAYLEFLTLRLKSDSVDIEKEYAAALKNLGQDSDIIALYSAWKQS